MSQLPIPRADCSRISGEPFLKPCSSELSALALKAEIVAAMRVGMRTGNAALSRTDIISLSASSANIEESSDDCSDLKSAGRISSMPSLPMASCSILKLEERT